MPSTQRNANPTPDQVLDCADLVQGYAALLHQHGRRRAVSSKQTPASNERVAARLKARDEAAASLLHRREELFGMVKRVSGNNRLSELKPTRDAKQKAVLYGIDPTTRYVHLPRTLPPPTYCMSYI